MTEQDQTIHAQDDEVDSAPILTDTDGEDDDDEDGDGDDDEDSDLPESSEGSDDL